MLGHRIYSITDGRTYHTQRRRVCAVVGAPCVCTYALPRQMRNMAVAVVLMTEESSRKRNTHARSESGFVKSDEYSSLWKNAPQIRKQNSEVLAARILIKWRTLGADLPRIAHPTYSSITPYVQRIATYLRIPRNENKSVPSPPERQNRHGTAKVHVKSHPAQLGGYSPPSWEGRKYIIGFSPILRLRAHFT